MRASPDTTNAQSLSSLAVHLIQHSAKCGGRFDAGLWFEAAEFFDAQPAFEDTDNAMMRHDLHATERLRHVGPFFDRVLPFSVKSLPAVREFRVGVFYFREDVRSVQPQLGDIPRIGFEYADSVRMHMPCERSTLLGTSSNCTADAASIAGRQCSFAAAILRQRRRCNCSKCRASVDRSQGDVLRTASAYSNRSANIAKVAVALSERLAK